MIALGSVMEGPSADALARELDPAYATIFHMWDTAQSSRVRQATAWLISMIAKFAPQLVFKNEETLRLMM